MDPAEFPGWELVEPGLRDLAAGLESVPACLVSIGAPRLARAGFDIPQPILPRAEHRLYELLSLEDPEAAHGRYNALIRRLVSFERAVECAR